MVQQCHLYVPITVNYDIQELFCIPVGLYDLGKKMDAKFW